MKRVAILVTTLLCFVAAHAETDRDIEKAALALDSVSNVLAQHRMNYARNEPLREKLAPTILSLERDIVRLQAEYDKAVEVVSQRDAKAALSAYADALKVATQQTGASSAVEEPKSSAYVPDRARMKRDLVANDYFAERLPQSDYATLLKSQRREGEIKGMVAQVFAEYQTLINLQRQYMEVPTKEAADSLTRLFAAQEQVIANLDARLSAEWSSLYYNKIYAYDLIMEREGKVAMLDYSAEMAARAEREINDNSGLYQSDALVNYYARKKALSEYESKIANELLLSTASDSLKVVVAGLKNQDYRLSKLSLERRSFINYEDIAVKIPSVYNSSNPIPQTPIYDYGTVYRIRIGLFSKKPSISLLRGVKPLYYSTEYNDGLYAYFVGGFRTEQEAKEGVAQLKRIGFRDPVVVAWVDGDYFSSLDEMHRSQNQYNVEISGIAALTDDIKAAILSHKSDCTISRIGSSFVVSAFEGKSAAESVAADLRALSGEINVKIEKHQ